MANGNGGDAHGAVVRLPAVELAALEVVARNVRAGPGRQEDDRRLVLDHRERVVRQVIEVHVRDDDGREGRQIVGIEARLDETRRKLADGSREHRIGQDERVVHLDERRRVTDPQDRKTRARPARVLDLVLDLRRLARRVEVASERAPDETTA